MFENALVESSRSKGAKRWLSLPVSLLVHAVLIGSVLAASAWAIDDLPDPPDRVVFGDLGPRQPPKALGEPTGEKTPLAKSTTSTPAPNLAPTSIPDLLFSTQRP